MGGPNRRHIFGDRVRGARIRADHARQHAREAAHKADTAECLLWPEQMEGPRRASAPVANDRYGWLEVMCKRCEIRASLPLDAVHRPAQHTDREA
jgi:hypothetical protein